MVCRTVLTTSLSKPSRLNVLFLGRDIFSSLNLRILHEANGKHGIKQGRVIRS